MDIYDPLYASASFPFPFSCSVRLSILLTLTCIQTRYILSCFFLLINYQKSNEPSPKQRQLQRELQLLLFSAMSTRLTNLRSTPNCSSLNSG